MSENPDPPATEASPAQGRLRAALGHVRSWIYAQRLALTLIIGMALLLTVPIVALRMTLFRPKRIVIVTLDNAWKAYALGDDSAVRREVELVEKSGHLSDQRLAAVNFLRGVLASRRAEQLLDQTKSRQEMLAEEYLSAAAEAGFPAGHEAEGNYLLGRNALAAGDWFEARKPLEESLKLEPKRASELNELLAEAYRHPPEPNYARALEFIAKVTADPSLSPERRRRVQLIQAELLFSTGDLVKCDAAINALDAAVADKLQVRMLKGRLRLEMTRQARKVPDQAAAVEKHAVEAIEVLRGAIKQAAVERESPADAQFLLGEALNEHGELEPALEQWQATRKTYFETSAGIASAARHADAVARNDRRDEALAAYRQLLPGLDLDALAKNPFVLPVNLREQVGRAYEALRLKGELEGAVELAQLAGPLVGEERSLEWAAQAEAEWGRALLASAVSLTQTDKIKTAEGQRHLRSAGANYEQLAKLRFASRAYPDDLWNSGDAYLAGHSYRRAAATWRTYLSAEVRKRRATALVNLAEASLALGDFDSVLQSCGEALEFHARDPASFRARLLAAAAHDELGDRAAAEVLLRQNLESDFLTPASGEWRQSLIALGKLLFRQGDYARAILKLQEAIERYPDDFETLECRYLIAQSEFEVARAAADSPRQLRQAEETAQTWQAALSAYDRTLVAASPARLAADPERAESIVRNCYFARGLILFELRRFEESLEAFGEITRRWPKSPVILEAYVQIANCYRRLDRPVEARITLQQAKSALQRLPVDARYSETTNYDRAGWVALLDELTST